MKTILAFLSQLLLTEFLAGQLLSPSPALDCIAFGSGSTSHVNVFSMFNNQASLRQLKAFSAGIYGEKKFLLQDLGIYHLALAIPTQHGNFGFNLGYAGSSQYHEQKAALAYARTLSDKLDVGVQFNYYSLNATGYGKSMALGFDASILLQLTENLKGGIHLADPTGSKFGRNGNERIPFVYTAALGFEASDKFFIGMEIQKIEAQPVNVNTGFQYRFLPRLLARAGIATATGSCWLGIGIGFGSLHLQATATIHPVLGITPGLLVLFDPEKNSSQPEKNSGQPEESKPQN